VITKVSDRASSNLGNVLQPEEVERKRAFKQSLDQQRYAIGHGLKRHLLSKYTGIPPRQLMFATGDYGKPYCLDDSAPHFNISHSGGWVVLAISSDTEVGVDIEFPRPVDESALMERIGSAYQFEQYLKSCNKMTSFLCFWSQKEAVSKLLGRGISMGLRKIESSGRIGHQCLQFMGKSHYIYTWKHDGGIISHASFSDSQPLVCSIC